MNQKFYLKGVAAVAVCSSFLVSCSSSVQDDLESEAKGTPRYLALSSQTTAPIDSDIEDSFRVIYENGGTEAGESISSMYSPQLQPYGDGAATATAENISTIGREGNLLDSHSVEGSIAVTTSSSSTGAKAASFVYNMTSELGGEKQLVATISDSGLATHTTESFPVALTTCDDGSTYWIDSSDDDGSLAVKMNPDGSTRETKIDDVSFDSAIIGEFDCATAGVNVLVGDKEDTVSRINITDATTSPEVSDRDSVSKPIVSEFSRSQGVTESSLVTVMRDGAYQQIPLSVGEPVIDGNLNIDDGLVTSVTFGHDELVVSHVAEAREGDFEVSTFDLSAPDNAIDHVVVKESSFNSETAQRDDLNGSRGAASILPLG